MLDGEIRASDAEREQTIRHLHDACGEGRLSLDEFSERAKAVYTARTRGELTLTTADLPRTVGTIARQRTPTRSTVAVMSEVKRRGRWRVDGETTVISVMASCTLDLRDALIHGDEVVVTTHVLMGEVKIVVPPGIRVELEGFVLMGSRESKVDEVRALPYGPTVYVRGWTVMGAVQVIEQSSQT